MSHFGYVKRAALTEPIERVRRDTRGRVTANILADGRSETISYAPDRITRINARGVPTTTVLDVAGRIRAIEDAYRKADSTDPFTTYRTRFDRDADGRIQKVV